MTESDPTAAAPDQADRPQFTPEAMAFAGKLASAAMAAENHAAWQALESAEKTDHRAVPTAILRDMMLGAWFVLEVPGEHPGPRVWLLPHLFGELVLQLPGRARVKVRAADVRAMFAWLKGGAAPDAPAPSLKVVQ